jgi:ribosomal protein S18 acetylase RimI-like enzyme
MTCVVQRRESTPFSAPRAHLYVDALGVSPDEQRQGVGRALMRHAETRARELGLGLDRVQLDVRNANPDAIRFYEALGYSPEQTKMSIEVDSG